MGVVFEDGTIRISCLPVLRTIVRGGGEYFPGASAVCNGLRSLLPSVRSDRGLRGWGGHVTRHCGELNASLLAENYLFFGEDGYDGGKKVILVFSDCPFVTGKRAHGTVDVELEGFDEVGFLDGAIFRPDQIGVQETVAAGFIKF